MTRPKKIQSDMGWSSRDKIVVRGFDLTSDLLGKINLGDMAFLELTGRLPTPAESETFNALLVTLVEHGLTPQAIASRLIHLSAPEALQGAVAAGLLGVGSVFAGGSEAVAKILQGALDHKEDEVDIEAAAAEIVENHIQRKTPVPGIGHPLHKPTDPRTSVLFAIAERNNFKGNYVRLLEAIARTAERRLSRQLPINATGAIGAILCELGFPWKICRGIAVIGRAIGLVGHVAEEMRNPIAREIWERTEREAAASTTTSAQSGRRER
jgi:citrate synthase